jgi:hypothetical protein
MTDIRFDIKKTGRVKILRTTRRVGAELALCQFQSQAYFPPASAGFEF